MRIRLAVLCFVSLLPSCRDEQAGPKPRVQSPPGAAEMRQAQPIEGPLPELSFRSGGSWASGAVTYLGSVVEPQKPKAGERVTLRHYFRADGEVHGAYRFFVHVLDGDTQQQIANLDHEFRAGPLGSWPKGKVMEDAHSFQMPEYAGAIELAVGFWNDDGRLSVDANQFAAGENRVRGPRFEAAKVALPEYVVPKAAKAPVIDGKLDDEIWKRAPEAVLVGSFDGRPTTKKTTVRLLWDDENLYVAFWAEDGDAWGTFRKKDDPIYNEDACEIFIDADGDGATYNELQVSPHNVNFDASFVSRRSDLAKAMQWESGMQTAVFVKGSLDDDSDRDEYWSAEMRIPLKGLTQVPRLPPRPGDRWRFNAYRLEHLRRRTQIEGQAFSPLFVGDFHALPRFGWLVFSQ